MIKMESSAVILQLFCGSALQQLINTGKKLDAMSAVEQGNAHIVTKHLTLPILLWHRAARNTGPKKGFCGTVPSKWNACPVQWTVM